MVPSQKSGRGTGTQTKVFGNGKILSNWEAFLRNKQNKQELFTYVGFPAGKVVLTTWDGKLLFNPIQQQSLPAQQFPLEPCNHEEFDPKAILHAASAAEQGNKNILIRANDEDPVFL